MKVKFVVGTANLVITGAKKQWTLCLGARLSVGRKNSSKKKKRQGRGSNLKAAIKPYYWDPGFVLNRGKLAMQIFLVTNYL